MYVYMYVSLFFTFCFIYKGELYQSILDGINGLTCAAIPDSAEMDKLINWNVLRASGKLLGSFEKYLVKLLFLDSIHEYVCCVFIGLDDDALISAVKIRVNNSTVILKSFSTQQSGEITLSGDALLVPSSNSSSTSVKLNDSKLSAAPITGAKISLCSRKDVRSDDTFLTLWSKYLSRPIVEQSLPAGVPEMEKSQGKLLLWHFLFHYYYYYYYYYYLPLLSLLLLLSLLIPLLLLLLLYTATVYCYYDLLWYCFSSTSCYFMCTDSSGKGGDRLSLYYSVGAVWLNDQKYVTKGFQFFCSFLCDWVSIHGRYVCMYVYVYVCSTSIMFCNLYQWSEFCKRDLSVHTVCNVMFVSRYFPFL